MGNFGMEGQILVVFMAPLQGLPLLSWCNLLSLQYFLKTEKRGARSLLRPTGLIPSSLKNWTRCQTFYPFSLAAWFFPLGNLKKPGNFLTCSRNQSHTNLYPLGERRFVR